MNARQIRDKEQCRGKLKEAIVRLTVEENAEIFKNKLDIKGMDELDLKLRILSYLDSINMKACCFWRKKIKRKMEDFHCQCYDENKLQEMKRLTHLILKLDSIDPIALNNLGVIFMGKGDYESAFEVFENVIKILRQRKRYRKSFVYTLVFNIKISLENIYKYEEMVRVGLELLKMAEDDRVIFPGKIKQVLAAYCLMATGHIREMRYEEALAVLVKGLLLDSSHSGIKLTFADYYESISDYESAKNQCFEVINKDRKNAQAWLQLGMTHIFSGDRENGKKCLVEAYVINRSDYAIKHNLLLCLIEQGKLPLLTNCDEEDYIDDLLESREGEKIIDNCLREEIIRKFIDECRDDG